MFMMNLMFGSRNFHIIFTVRIMTVLSLNSFRIQYSVLPLDCTVANGVMLPFGGHPKDSINIIAYVHVGSYVWFYNLGIVLICLKHSSSVNRSH